jgi:hypothetical protein
MKRLTVGFTLLVVVLIAGFDVWTILANGVETSISELIIQTAYRYPWLTFACGFLCGHLFWQMPKKKEGLE